MNFDLSILTVVLVVVVLVLTIVLVYKQSEGFYGEGDITQRIVDLQNNITNKKNAIGVMKTQEQIKEAEVNAATDTERQALQEGLDGIRITLDELRDELQDLEAELENLQGGSGNNSGGNSCNRSKVLMQATLGEFTDCLMGNAAEAGFPDSAGAGNGAGNGTATAAGNGTATAAGNGTATAAGNGANGTATGN